MCFLFLNSFLQVNAWKADLNHVLPPALYQTEVWLQEVEELVEEGLPASQDYSEARALLQEKMTLFQVRKEQRNMEIATLC